MGNGTVSTASKSSPPSGISPAEAQRLRSQVEELEKLVREQLDERNQWNNLARKWVGQTVRAVVSTNQVVVGKLLWLDRYTLCIDGSYTEVMSQGKKDPWPNREIIIHKGQLVMIHQEV
jgi:hypothetical protein